MTVTLHEMRTRHEWPVITASCSCGQWAASQHATGRANTLRDAHRDHQREARRVERAQTRAEALDWHARTGHCADCSQPGSWCQCTKGCRCESVHPTGSGVGRSAADVFAQHPVSQDQGSLF